VRSFSRIRGRSRWLAPQDDPAVTAAPTLLIMSVVRTRTAVPRRPRRRAVLRRVAVRAHCPLPVAGAFAARRRVTGRRTAPISCRMTRMGRAAAGRVARAARVIWCASARAIMSRRCRSARAAVVTGCWTWPSPVEWDLAGHLPAVTTQAARRRAATAEARLPLSRALSRRGENTPGQGAELLPPPGGPQMEGDRPCGRRR